MIVDQIQWTKENGGGFNRTYGIEKSCWLRVQKPKTKLSCTIFFLNTWAERFDRTTKKLTVSILTWVMRYYKSMDGG